MGHVLSQAWTWPQKVISTLYFCQSLCKSSLPMGSSNGLLRQTNHQRNTQGDDEQQRLTKVAFIYQLMQGISQGTYIVLNPFSSHAHYQLHKSGTCHNTLNTYMLMEIVVTKTQNDKHTLQQTNLCQRKWTKLTIEQGLTRVQLILCLCVCVCVCVCVCKTMCYIYIYTHTHTHLNGALKKKQKQKKSTQENCERNSEFWLNKMSQHFDNTFIILLQYILF